MTLQCKNSMHTNWNDIITKRNVIHIVVNVFMHEQFFLENNRCVPNKWEIILPTTTIDMLSKPLNNFIQEHTLVKKKSKKYESKNIGCNILVVD